jgi:hypothetical protein
MVERIDATQMLLTPEEAAQFDAQAAAQASGSASKAEARYQNEPRGEERCDKCSMFVAGFPTDPGGFCTKVTSFRGGPLGTIFADGWCRFFEPDPLAEEQPEDFADLK